MWVFSGRRCLKVPPTVLQRCHKRLHYNVLSRCFRNPSTSVRNRVTYCCPPAAGLLRVCTKKQRHQKPLHFYILYNNKRQLLPLYFYLLRAENLLLPRNCKKESDTKKTR